MMSARVILCVVVALLAMPAPLLADSRMDEAPLANIQLEDPTKERAAKALMETIRCLVCQGQSIADSDAEMAADMRSLIRRRIQAGENPSAIRAWLIERYGSYITYSPPMSAETLLLWGLPLLLLALGLWIARGRIRTGNIRP